MLTLALGLAIALLATVAQMTGNGGPVADWLTDWLTGWLTGG